MKLCVLNKKLNTEPLFSDDYNGFYLYHIPLKEYLKHVLRGNTCLCETTNITMVFMYTESVIRGKFELGEEMISKSSYYSFRYALDVLNDRFKDGEEMISKSYYRSYMYAVYVLKERFLLGEVVIKKTMYREDYEKHFGIKL